MLIMEMLTGVVISEPVLYNYRYNWLKGILDDRQN